MMSHSWESLCQSCAVASCTLLILQGYKLNDFFIRLAWLRGTVYYSKVHTIPTITTATSAPLTLLTVTTITTTACYFLYNIHTPFCSLVPYLIPPGNCRLVGPQWPALSISGEWGLEARTGRSSLKLQGGPWESRVKKKTPRNGENPHPSVNSRWVSRVSCLCHGRSRGMGLCKQPCSPADPPQHISLRASKKNCFSSSSQTLPFPWALPSRLTWCENSIFLVSAFVLTDSDPSSPFQVSFCFFPFDPSSQMYPAVFTATQLCLPPLLPDAQAPRVIGQLGINGKE